MRINEILDNSKKDVFSEAIRAGVFPATILTEVNDGNPKDPALLKKAEQFFAAHRNKPRTMDLFFKKYFPVNIAYSTAHSKLVIVYSKYPMTIVFPHNDHPYAVSRTGRPVGMPDSHIHSVPINIISGLFLFSSPTERDEFVLLAYMTLFDQGWDFYKEEVTSSGDIVVVHEE